MLSEKEKIILNTLLNNQDPLSIKEISKLTKIKERTLYREIKNLEQSIKNEKFFLEKEKSKYKLSGEVESIDNSIIDTTIELGYSTDNKINLILCDLIFSKETSIKDISEKFYLSYNTVANSVNIIENILIDYKIKLIRKKGAGIYLEGKEIDKRILLISILCNEIKDDEFFSIIHSLESFSANPFVKFLDIDFIKKIYLKNKDLEIFNVYTDSSIKKILISINISFVRYGIKLDSREKNGNLDIEKKYIQELINTINKYTNFDDYTEVEIFLLEILKTCKLIEQVTYFNDKYSYTLIYKINTLIKNISEKSDIDFTSDKNLVNGLIVHIESSIKRFQLKLYEENNDLQEFVIKNYNELYLIVKSEIIEIFKEIQFNPTELSYIVLHFASSYEQIYRENFIRALVVCSSGIGSSKILGSLIRKNINEIKNIEYSIPSKLDKEDIDNYDIIISTIKLDSEIDYIQVPTILRDEDVTKIKNKLLEVRSFKNRHTKIINIKENINCDDINKILEKTSLINQLTASTDIFYLLEDALKNIEIKNKKLLINKLITRHNKSSVVIPNTQLALFHTLFDDIKSPIIVIYNLEKEITLNNAIGEIESVNKFFIMLSPNINKYTELLGQISVAILDDKMLKKALNSKSIDFIKTKLELIMTKHLLENKEH
ncbi:PRD domain-containing protein [Gemella palaticanis]|uniref:PRD domain-containing protein n=1 Tax=Gemelliphila palaticanis TaxID=81950 RepID=A0ABX2T0Q9_9BACL|nr:PRD domain-containing protein [Gemella palaticanis]NYS46601.1 PRD domain-containing protein [Gemella palaticanis]